MTVQDETTASEGIILSDAAAEKVKALLEQEGRDDLALRVAVQPGGCSGLRYQLFFDERSLDGDIVKDFNGVKVVTDRAWFAARPSGTEDVYKIYAESFVGQEHLEQVQREAKEIVDAALGA